MEQQIRAQISEMGKWYETDNYRVYTGKEFAEETGVLLAANAARIQRQCDGYAIEM